MYNKMEFEGSIGEWSKQRCKALDLTQAELGDLVGCSAEYIHKIEQGTRRPSKVVAPLLADALSVPSDKRERFIDLLRSFSDVAQPSALSQSTSGT